MKQFTLSNGVKIPGIAYGTWRMPASAACTEAVLCALKTGYRHIDTAARYENETSVGQALKQSGLDRKEVFLTSKVWNNHHTYEACRASFESSLHDLGTDYLDLFLIHWPRPASCADAWEGRNAEMWRAMEDLYAEGKVRAIGVSNFMPHHLDALLKTAKIVPMVNQIELHMGCMQSEAVQYSREKGMTVEAWAPFAIGKVLTQPAVCQVAEEVHATPAQVALAFLLQQDILPLPKSVTPSRMAENLQALDLQLTEAQMQKIAMVSDPILARRHDPDKIDF